MHRSCKSGKLGILPIEEEFEHVWLSTVSEKIYRIESIPFFSYDYTYLDEVMADTYMLGEEEILLIKAIVQPSPYVDFRVHILNEEVTEYMLARLEAAYLKTEKSSQRMYAIAALPHQIGSLQGFLENGSKLGHIEWEIGRSIS